MVFKDVFPMFDLFPSPLTLLLKISYTVLIPFGDLQASYKRWGLVLVKFSHAQVQGALITLIIVC